MTNAELEKLINDDIPKKIGGKPDAKTMLDVCKAKNIESQKMISKLSIVLSCLMLVLVGAISISFGLKKHAEIIDVVNPIENTTNLNGNYNMEKIDIKVDNKTINDAGDDMIDNPDSQIIEWYGIEINIRCDYSKHPKYKEWEEEFYNGNYQTDPYDTRPLDYHLINFLHKKIYEYESMDVLFSNQQTHSFWPGSQIINIDYMAKKGNSETMEEAVRNMEEYLKDFYETDDYNNLLELANKDYITKIVIIERWPRINGDESGDLTIGNE